MKNESRDYNDTVESYIARVCLRAYEIFKEEISRTDQETAINRAIGDSIKQNISLLHVEHSFDRNLLSEAPPSYIQHIHETVFLNMSKHIYDSNYWRCDKWGFPIGEKFRYTIAVMKIGGGRK